MWLTNALTALFLAALAGAPAVAQDERGSAQAGDTTQTLLAELRHSFALHGKPIPPEIFRDFGDGDLGDSGAIWVTVDAAATIGSELYGDPIRQDHGWVIQEKPNQSMNYFERTCEL